MDSGTLSGRIHRRTLMACQTCRRRKTKCDGSRPRCRYCAAHDIPCVWSGSGAYAAVNTAFTEPTLSPPASEQGPVRLLEVSRVSTAPQLQLPTRQALEKCLDLFYSRHFATDFCCFDYWPDFQETCQKKPFLVHAIIALCSRYLEASEAMACFGMPAAKDVCIRYTQLARCQARDASDKPSVAHIQSYLVLAVAELLSNSGSSHWMYAGTAIRMAQIMRLNKEFHQKHDLREQEIRRRTFWACFCIDRALASFLAKPLTIDTNHMVVALPSTDTSLAYREGSRGLMLNTISAFDGYPSDVGLLPYLIKTIEIWGTFVAFNTRQQRNVDSFPPTDQRSQFFAFDAELQHWVLSLAPSLRWGLDNYRNQSNLGRGREFVAMHVLLHASHCVGHQAYLPQTDGFTVLRNGIDPAGWSFLRREISLMETCVSHALDIGDMLETLLNLNSAPSSMGPVALQSIWVAHAALCASNTYFWILYSNDETFSTEIHRDKARKYVRLCLSLATSWEKHWDVARQWHTAMDAMHAMYRAAYLGDIRESPLDSGVLTPSESVAADHSDDGSEDTDSPESEFRPRPGDGYPSLIDFPDLQSSLRVIGCDSTAKALDIRTVWMQLLSGWPCDPSTIMDVYST